MTFILQKVLYVNLHLQINYIEQLAAYFMDNIDSNHSNNYHHCNKNEYNNVIMMLKRRVTIIWLTCKRAFAQGILKITYIIPNSSDNFNV